MGALFSATVGYVGMNMAVQGNVRVAAAARTSFGKSLQIAYRTGTITGMLTDSLGLLGGTLIFLWYGEKAYEVLKPGGRLFLTTGDIGSWVARIQGPRWRLIHPPTHLHYFSKATITRLLTGLGFSVQEVC